MARSLRDSQRGRPACVFPVSSKFVFQKDFLNVTSLIRQDRANYRAKQATEHSQYQKQSDVPENKECIAAHYFQCNYSHNLDKTHVRSITYGSKPLGRCRHGVRWQVQRRAMNAHYRMCNRRLYHMHVTRYKYPERLLHFPINVSRKALA